MERRFALIIGAILAMLLGIIAAFLVVIIAVFSGSRGIFTNTLMIFSVIFIIYGILGALLGFIGPSISWKWGIWLNIPAVMAFLLYAVIGLENTFMYVLYLSLAVISGCFGAYIGTLAAFSRRDL